jgi:hypothetical protein
MVQLLVDLAGALVDGFGAVVVDGQARERGDLARESLAIDADQRRDPFAIGWDLDLLEDRQPALDARLDRVDQGAVQVEDHGVWAGQVADGGHVRTLEDDEAVAIGILAGPECRQAVTRADREFAPEIWGQVGDVAVVAVVGDKQDGSLSSQVALLRW